MNMLDWVQEAAGGSSVQRRRSGRMREGGESVDEKEERLEKGENEEEDRKLERRDTRRAESIES